MIFCFTYFYYQNALNFTIYFFTDVMKLDWHCLEDIDVNYYPDIVIGADIVYDPSILLPLCSVLDTFFNRNPYLQVYIASVIRNEDTFDQFTKVLGNLFCSIYYVFY